MVSAVSNYWFSRVFDCYAIFGKGADQKLYEWNVWAKVWPRFDVLFSRPDTVIESAQFEGISDKPVSFRGLRWNAESHERWTVGSPLTTVSSIRRYLTTQFWAPSQKHCAETAAAPDVFMEVTGYDNVLAFDQGVFIAVARDQKVCISKIIEFVALSLSPICIAHQVAPWGETISDGRGYTNCLSDFMDTGVPLYLKSITCADLRGNWVPFSP